ncbi:hypothetical protein KFE25_002795 [Diacronema lutheri]|uniref:PPPDE domain-containing protein n=2 Tax=Diacronema lutheri TaxID=2081491 RepID=A0A8J6CFC2_DIALT|nr:hypothetical protein KFE25_002795 [Diacronema lutheri]
MAGAPPAALSPPARPFGWATVSPMQRLAAAVEALKRFFGIGTDRRERERTRNALFARVKLSAERLAATVVNLARPAQRKPREPRRLAAGAVDVPRPWRVRVHVYRLVSSRTNRLIQSVGVGGVYHTGVEVGGVEYGFGYHEHDFSGVWKQIPRQLPRDFARGRAVHCALIDMGVVTLSARALQQLLAECMREFVGKEYSVLHRNCNHFTAELCERLVHKPPPRWINAAAAKGAIVSRTLARATLSVARIGRAFNAPLRVQLRLSRRAGQLKSPRVAALRPHTNTVAEPIKKLAPATRRWFLAAARGARRGGDGRSNARPALNAAGEEGEAAAPAPAASGSFGVAGGADAERV